MTLQGPRFVNRSTALDIEGLMDNFDPNQEPEGDWATFIPRWRGAFHVHKTRAAALRACNPRFAPNAVLYTKSEGVWIEVHRHDERDFDPPEKCEKCGLKPQAIKGAFGGPVIPHEDRIQRGWVRVRGKIVDPPVMKWLCRHCRR